MDNIIDLIATDAKASDVSDAIKSALFAKAAEKIDVARPIVAARLVNNSASAALVTVVETQSGNGIGSMTMPPNSVEYLEKQPSYCVFASADTVKGAKVGFTG